WQNYPNPFVHATTIRYQLPVKAKVSLRIYDISGRMVKELVNAEQPAGEYKVAWETKNLTSGIYFAKLEAVPINRDFPSRSLSGQVGSASTGYYKQVKKLILVR
ncbi:MAG: T9SS type A sorting domain-containing protein, partial [Candidatus Stahlbacteria bacterium]|nr:T9SS type A sorting domain-containing protein [Candidatus Stahlbacteria bacterium]